MLLSVIIAALRWDGFLQNTLESIVAQELPPHASLEIAVALAEPRLVPPDDQRILLLHNPARSTPAGLNVARAATTGEIVFRVDSRCVLPPRYFLNLLEHVRREAVGCAGGGAVCLDVGVLGSAYATAFNSPLLGTGRFRFSNKSGPTDTAYLGAWRRTVLDALNGFDERMLRNQDGELAQRIRFTGLEVWYDASIGVGYFSNRNVAGHIRHHHEFGIWRTMRQRSGAHGFEARHVSVIVTFFLLLFGAAFWMWRGPRPWSFVSAGVAYALAALAAAGFAARMRRKLAATTVLNVAGVALAPLLALVLDVAWIAGMARAAISGKRLPLPSTASSGDSS